MVWKSVFLIVPALLLSSRVNDEASLTRLIVIVELAVAVQDESSEIDTTIFLVVTSGFNEPDL